MRKVFTDAMALHPQRLSSTACIYDPQWTGLEADALDTCALRVCAPKASQTGTAAAADMRSDALRMGPQGTGDWRQDNLEHVVNQSP